MDPTAGQASATSRPAPVVPVAWRDEVSRVFLLATLPLVIVGTLVLFGFVEQPLVRGVLTLTAAAGAMVVAAVIWLDWPRGAVRAGVVVGIFVLFGGVGAATLGFLAGPSAAFATAMLAAALLLGRRGVARAGLLIAAVVGGVGWGVVTGRLAPPPSVDVLVTSPVAWFRTWTVALAFFVIMGAVVARVVRLLEEAAEQARREVARREVAERERLETLRAAMESQKFEVIGQLAAGIAHDFNNALTAITGASQLAVSDLPPDSPALPLLELVQEAALRSRSLTQQLLAFARKGPVASAPVVVHDTLRAALALVARSFDPRITLVTKFDAPSSTVQGDATLLYNAILNLALNARDAMPDGGTLTVATRVDTPDADTRARIGLDPGPHLVVDVIDTGTGIPAELRPRLFEPFFTTKPVGKGTGLGLPAVLGTMRTHRGAVTVDSTPGRGSTFTLHLPLAPAPAPIA